MDLKETEDRRDLDDIYETSTYCSELVAARSEFYPDAKEETPPDQPIPGIKKAQITIYVDADHAHDQVTQRSVTRIILFMNGTLI